jgi:hypothetical protein
MWIAPNLPSRPKSQTHQKTFGKGSGLRGLLFRSDHPFELAGRIANATVIAVQVLVVKLSDLSFLSAEDLESAADIGEKIIRQFAFLPGELAKNQR